MKPAGYSDIVTGQCDWCHEEVPPSKSRSDGKGVKRRRFCNDKCSQNWWNGNREKTGRAPGRPRTPGRGKRYWIYGLLDSDVEELRQAQEYGCAICYAPLEDDENVDHCHETNKVRGLLCGFCNRGLGMFTDSPERLRAAADYLEKFKL